MARLYALFCVTVFVVGALFLSGCVAPNSQVTTPTPQVIIQGDSPGREVVQPIEIDNCDGKADLKRTEHRTRSVESTISAEVAAKFGVSAEVLSAEVQTTVGASIGWTEGQGTSIELVAPPGTRMAFQLVWVGNEQVGVIQNLRGSSIPIAFRIFKPTDVRIKSQYDIGCPPRGGQNSPEPKPTTPKATPTQPITALSPKTPIETMNRQQLAAAFGVPKDRIVRESSKKIHIFDYPLRPEYGQDEEGYILKNGQRMPGFEDKDVMNFGTPQDAWKYYLGPLNWRVPEKAEIGVCKVGIWTGGNSGRWTSTLRFVTNDDSSVSIEGASRAWITCSDEPAGTWAREEAMRAKSDPGAVGVYYWDSKSNQWINVK